MNVAKNIFALSPLDIAIQLRRACWRALAAKNDEELRRLSPIAERAGARLEGSDAQAYACFIVAYAMDSLR